MATPKKQGQTMATQTQMENVEMTVLAKITPEAYHPRRVHNALVTMEEVTSILDDVVLTPTDLEESISSRRKQPVETISVSDELDAIRSLTEGHRAVLDAVLSQLAAGNSIITSGMIYRTMSGKSSDAFIHQSSIQMVDKYMQDLMYTPMRINMPITTSDGEAAGGILDGPILPAERITIKMSGAKCTAYQISTLPIVFRYARALQSISVSPIALRNIPDMSYTARNINILNILHRKVAPLLYPPTGRYVRPQPLVIEYQPLFDTVIDKNSAQMAVMRRRVRTVVASILNTWVNNGTIAKWEELKDGLSFSACRIYFPDSDPPLQPVYRQLPSVEKLHRN